MKKKWLSAIAVMVCVCVCVTNVFAYPISPNTYKMSTTPTDDLTDEESVVWESTKPKEDFAYSPAICVTESGRIVVSYDISGEKGEVKYSDDGGTTWVQATMSDDDFLFARPFETESGLYLVARRYAASAEDGNGQLIMFKSEDNGQTWGDASVIDSGVWHSAPSEVVHLNGYIYMTWEAQDKAAAQATGGAGRGILAPVILRARETADLTVASNWTISDSEETYLSYYDAVGGNSYSKIDYMGIPFMHYRFGDNTNLMGWLEGNIVRITDPSHVLYDENAFYIYLRSTANTSDYANLMKIVENEDGTMTSELVTTPSGKTNLYVQLPGGQSKFYITYDEQEELYWLVSNVSTDSMEIDTTFDKGADTSRHEGPQDVRNELGLYYSSNAMDWNFAGIVSATDSINQARSYPSMVIDGNDLLVVSRSGDEDAQSAHNTNLITFHKIKNFRRLANEALISEEQENLVYSPDVLDDSSVKDTHTYITENGTTLVACSISDETSTTSKVLVKQEDGTYVETLSTGYKLGEPFEVDETIYVFGVADHKLVAFTSTNEGVAWNGPYAIDTTRDWYEAPTSVVVDDEQVMLALSEIGEGAWATLRGYNSETTGSVTYDKTTDTVDFNGYGAGTYTEAFYLEEGDSLSFNVAPTTLDATGAYNDFGIAFLDAPTFYGNTESDYADGFAINIKSNTNYADGVFHVYTSYVDQGNVPNINVNTERVGAKGLQGGLLNQNLELKFTKKTQTISDVEYAWQLTVTYTNENSVRTTLIKNIPATQVPANAFDNGLWFSAGARSGKVVQYKVADLTKETKTESQWGIYSGTGYANTVTDNGDGSVTLKGKTATYYKEKIAVQEGTRISFDVTFPTVVANSTIQYGFALTSATDKFYYNNQDVVSGNAISAELTAMSQTGKLTAQGAIRKANEARVVKAGAVAVTSDWTQVQGKTYTITYEKQPSESDYSWIMTATEQGGTPVTMKILDDDFADNLLGDEVYIMAGSAAGAAHEVKVSNIKVSQKRWEIYSGTGYANTVTESGDGSVTLKGKTATYYKEKIAVQEGTRISFDVTFPTVVANSTIQYGFALTSATDKFYYNNQDVVSGNAISAELTATSQTGKLTAQGAIRKANEARVVKAGAVVTSDWTQVQDKTYTITYEKQPSESDYSWIMTATEQGGTPVTMKIIDDDFADNLLGDEVYIMAGSPAGAAHEIEISNVKVKQPGGQLVTDVVETGIKTNERYMATPVIMTASISSSLLDADSWTYFDGGESFINKIGNAYANDKFDYFGLPYADKDIRTIGWSDLQLFEVYETDDIRHDNQLNSGETTGNLYGYMTLQNAGYDYAAFVKINTNTQKVEFFTPAGLSAEITEEEMVLSKMPGGNNGFEIFWDETSSLYWLVTTEHTDSTSDSKETRVAIYYGTNAYDWRSAGVVAELSGDARVSAVVEGKQLVITALNKDIVQYTVPNFRELANMSGLSDWVNIRGYNTATSKITSTGNKVTLAGYGGAMCNTKIEVQEGTTIEFTLTPTDLTNSPYFTVGLTNKANSFVGGDTDTGSGIAVTILPWSSLDGAAIRYSPVTSGQANPALASGALVGGSQVTATMLNNDFTFKFVKRSQTISGVDYSWYLEITEKLGGVVKTQNIKISELSEDCFDDGLYLIAGGSNGRYVSYEISDVTVTQPVVGDVNHDGEINILDIAALDYGIGNDSVVSYEKHIYNVDGDESVTIDYQDVNAIRADVLAH